MYIHIPAAYVYGLLTIPALLVVCWAFGIALMLIYGWYVNH